jgi:hypothetical protein
MGRITRIITGAVLATALAAPAGAETWARFSSTDRTVYLVDLDTLTPTDGLANSRIARVPLGDDAAERGHEVEEITMRCADKQFRSGATISYGPDGAETDRYTEETAWEPARDGTLYAGVMSFVCEDMRPADATPYPTLKAFMEGGRGR